MKRFLKFIFSSYFAFLFVHFILRISTDWAFSKNSTIKGPITSFNEIMFSSDEITWFFGFLLFSFGVICAISFRTAKEAFDK